MNYNVLAGYTVIWFLGFVSCDPSSSPESIIRNNRIASNLAIAKHDTATLSSFWTDDIMVVTSRNFQTSGKQEYAGALDKEFKTKKDVIYIRTIDKVDVFAEWGMASENGHWVGRWQEGDEKIEVSGTYYAKWQYVSENWLIRAEVYTPLGCKGGSYCRSIISQSSAATLKRNQ